MTARKSSPFAELNAPGTFSQTRYRGRIKSSDAVVSPDMTQDQINDAVKAAASENKVLEVQAGDYSNGENNHKKVIIDASGMTVLLKGGDYIRAQIITRRRSPEKWESFPTQMRISAAFSS